MNHLNRSNITRIATRVAMPFAVLLLLGQGCTGSSTATPTADGGVYKTTDRATTWTQKRVLVKGAKAVSLGADPITTIVIDPEDQNAIYAGTLERGIVTSLNGGDTWEEVTNGPKGAKIQSIAVDPKDKCVVYATMKNKIYKTENCHRDWKEIFFDPKVDKTFTVVTVDWYNPTLVYAGTSEGDIFKSTDAGLSWMVVKRANASISTMVFDPRDSRILYVGTFGEGIWKTLDGGMTWLPIRDQLKSFTNARGVNALELDNADPSRLYLASKYGLLMSENGGEEWKEMPLTSEAGSVEVLDVAVNPREVKEIMYITKNTLFMTTDAGATWSAKKLPSVRSATVLLQDQEDGKTLYLGFGSLPK
jgi:photosystem II stability/assembly factor-like uncharacterized protein